MTRIILYILNSIQQMEEYSQLSEIVLNILPKMKIEYGK